MEQLLEKKILKIKEVLKDRCFIKSSEFDTNYAEAKIEGDEKGGKWNDFVHDNCLNYNFEIWKYNGKKNVYVKNSAECKEYAAKEGFRSWTTETKDRNKERRAKQ